MNASGAFATVLFARPIDGQALASAETPLASVVPLGWEEFDDVDPISIARRVDFSLSILVRDDDPWTRYDRSLQLEAVARDAIAGSGLGGGCLPQLTRIRRGSFDRRARHPEQVTQLAGEFTYLTETTVVS